eukprot:jgi/Galph1/2597/GphlegSOOS_G1273.1
MQSSSDSFSVPFYSFLNELKRCWDRSCQDEDGSKISLAELCLGVQYLMEKQDSERAKRIVPRSLILKDPFVLIQLRHFCMLAHGAYEESVDKICSKTPLLSQDIIYRQLTSKKEQPAYYIAVDHATQNIVLAICGTKSFHDILTDVSIETSDFLGAYGHKGMVSAVYWLVSQVLDKLIEQQNKRPDYGMVCVGHSLGGAVATLFTLLMRTQYDIHMVCYSYGAPPCICSALLPLTKEGGIIQVILDTDIIPRLSLHSLDQLVVELRTLDWQQVYFRGSTIHTKLHQMGNTYLGEETTNQLSQQVSKYLQKQLRSNSHQVVDKAKQLVISQFITSDNQLSSQWLDKARQWGGRYWQSYTQSASSTSACSKEPILYVGGTIWHIQREGNKYYAVPITETDSLNHIELSHCMLQDHRISVLENALQQLQIE